jgi:hypothetical protein
LEELLLMTRFAAAALVCSIVGTGSVFAQQAPPSSRVITKLPSVTFGEPSPVQAGTQPKSTAAGKALLQMAERARAAEALTRKTATTRTICGMTVVEQSPDLDARAILPADRSEGASVRRVEPQVCAAGKAR